MNIDETARVLANEQCLLFVGSGISISTPSCLPSAYSAATVFLTRLADGILPPKTLERLLERNFLPEFVYGVCERYFDARVYESWRSLEYWRHHPNLFSSNAGHLAATYIANHSRTPILTPNFDTYLEDAAERLGLVPQVTVAMPGKKFRPILAEKGQVAIWKLHGTAEDPASVFSSVRTLTSPTPGLRRNIKRAVTDSGRLIFAGYSGRDLDLFPLITGQNHKQPPIWIDLAFNDDHRSAHLMPETDRVTCAFDELGRRLAAVTGSPLLTTAISQADVRVADLEQSKAADNLKRSINTHFENVADQLTDPVGRRLLFAELLINAGMSEEANNLLQDVTAAARQETERVRLQAKALWELGRFRASRDAAYSRSLEKISPSERDTLQYAVYAAVIRANVPPRGLPGTRPPSRGYVLYKTLRSTWLLAKGFWRVMHPGKIPEPTRTPFVEGWLEHAIRLMLTIQTTLVRPNGRTIRPISWGLSLIWLLLRRESRRLGYAEGIGNTGRYLARLGIDEPDGVRAAHDFLGHSLGMIIAHRDAAESFLIAGDRASAELFFAHGLTLLKEQEDPVLILTFIPLAKKLGCSLEIDESLIEKIEADWANDYLTWKRSMTTGGTRR